MVNVTPWPLYPEVEAPVPLVKEAGWSSELVWMVMEKRKPLAATGVQTPDLPTCSESVYRLSYSNNSVMIMKMGRLLFKTTVSGYLESETSFLCILSVGKDIGEKKEKISEEVKRIRRVREE